MQCRLKQAAQVGEADFRQHVPNLFNQISDVATIFQPTLIFTIDYTNLPL